MIKKLILAASAAFILSAFATSAASKPIQKATPTTKPSCCSTGAACCTSGAACCQGGNCCGMPCCGTSCCGMG